MENNDPFDLDGRAVVPGDTFAIPSGTVVHCGAGVMRSDDSCLVVMKNGLVRQSTSRNQSAKSPPTVTITVENCQKRYNPATGDQILGVVTSKQGDHYRLDILSTREGYLPVLSFQGATKRNRPNLNVGAVVYAQIAVANVDIKAELTCISTQFKKEWMTGESVFGELTGGYMFTCSTKLVRQLLADDCVVLNVLGNTIPFEIAIGVNGRVWIKAGSYEHSILISNCIANSEHLTDQMTILMVNELVNVHSRQS